MEQAEAEKTKCGGFSVVGIIGLVVACLLGVSAVVFVWVALVQEIARVCGWFFFPGLALAVFLGWSISVGAMELAERVNK